MQLICLKTRTLQVKYLPNAINKLKEDGASVCVVVLVVSMTRTLSKLVPKAQPLLLNQNLVEFIRILRRANIFIIYQGWY